MIGQNRFIRVSKYEMDKVEEEFTILHYGNLVYNGNPAMFQC